MIELYTWGTPKVDSRGPEGKPMAIMESGAIAGGRRQRALGLRKDDKEAAP